MLLTKRDHIFNLTQPGAICAELGVAKGEFSERGLRDYPIGHLYSIDRWSDHHNLEEYKETKKRLYPYKDRNTILKMTFDEALVRFPDEFFDLIYIDGYAHTGQEDGKTLKDWYPKVKPGGVFAGDDYTHKYQKTVDVVDAFMYNMGLDLHIINCSEKTWESRYPTWYAIKP